MKVVIVGGVAGGASAAARIRRLDEHAQIIMIERSGYISYANCGLPYYVGGVIKEQEELTLQTPESFWDRFRIDVRGINKLADSLDEQTMAVFRNIVDNVYLGGKDQEILEDCIITLEIEKLRDRYEEISTIIELADETENQEKIRQLMTEQMEIQKLMQQMKERG